MSHKLAKQIRAKMRDLPRSAAHKTYDIVRHVCGDPTKPYESFQVVLTPGCGRDLYQRSKRAQ